MNIYFLGYAYFIYQKEMKKKKIILAQAHYP